MQVKYYDLKPYATLSDFGRWENIERRVKLHDALADAHELGSVLWDRDMATRLDVERVLGDCDTVQVYSHCQGENPELWGYIEILIKRGVRTTGHYRLVGCGADNLYWAMVNDFSKSDPANCPEWDAHKARVKPAEWNL